MRRHQLDIENYQSPGQVVKFLNEHEVKRGDVLNVTTREQKINFNLLVISIVAIAIVIYMGFKKQKKQREEDGEKMLKNFFNDNTLEEIEKQVELEYGIKIEIESRPDEERDFWNILSLLGLSKAYSPEEPDYSDVTLMEPNPNYKPWNREK